MSFDVKFSEADKDFDSQIEDTEQSFNANLEEADRTFDPVFTETSRTFDARFKSSDQTFDTLFLVGDIYRGAYAVTPKTVGQKLPTKRKVMADDVSVHAIPYFEVGNTSGGSTVYIGNDSEIEIE